MTTAIIIFWICVWAMAHSYLLYPFSLQLLIWLRGEKKYNSFSNNEDSPSVTILMAAYNEEAVIEKKIRSIFNTTYPLNKIEVLVGSDCSTDSTNSILFKLSREFEQLDFTNFNLRQGKIKIINQLSEKGTGEILIITDANVLLEEKTLFETLKLFKDKRIGLVDTHMKNYGLKKDGISIQEKTYISREVFVKHLESASFGTMIGPFGGCYAVRKELYAPVPENYTVDDFFICMNVLAKKKLAINNLEAIVNEDVSNVLAIEFKRKIRIATGNFQNLKHFFKLLLNPFSPRSYTFFSHKVLRWFGPFFLIIALLSNIFLIGQHPLYLVTFILQLLVIILPFVDTILKKFGIHIVLLRFITHFYIMNLSLLIGFVKSIKGVKSNVWKPTKRFQE